MRRRARIGMSRSRTGQPSWGTDAGAVFDTEVVPGRRAALSPFVHLGNQPGPGRCRWALPYPIPHLMTDDAERQAAEKALAYHGPSTRSRDARHCGRRRVRRVVHQDGRIEDCEWWADLVRGPQGGPGCPDAGRPGLDAGALASRSRRNSARFLLPRAPNGGKAGCSMCLGMNPDQTLVR